MILLDTDVMIDMLRAYAPALVSVHSPQIDDSHRIEFSRGEAVAVHCPTLGRCLIMGEVNMNLHQGPFAVGMLDVDARTGAIFNPGACCRAGICPPAYAPNPK
jgi:hypothetical protein